MAVNGGESSRSSETKVCATGDMLIRIGIPVLLRKTKINKVCHRGLGPNAHENVAGFEIPVDEVTRMNVLEATDLELQMSVSIISEEKTYLPAGQQGVERFGQ